MITITKKDDARILAALRRVIDKHHLINDDTINRIDIIEDGSGFDELRLFRGNTLIYKVIIPDDEVDSAF